MIEQRLRERRTDGVARGIPTRVCREGVHGYILFDQDGQQRFLCVEVPREIDECDGGSCCQHSLDGGCGGGACAERICAAVTGRDKERQIAVLAVPCKGSAEHGNLLARCHIVRHCHKGKDCAVHVCTRVAQRNARQLSSCGTQLIHRDPCKHGERDFIRAVHNHRPFGGDIFLREQGRQLRFFQIADRIFLTVVLSEDEAREHALLREVNEHGGERRALIEVCKVFLQIVIGERTAQPLHLRRIDGQSLARAPEETRIGEQGASLTPALDPVLWNRTRQDVKRVQQYVRVRRVQCTQIHRQ